MSNENYIPDIIWHDRRADAYEMIKRQFWWDVVSDAWGVLRPLGLMGRGILNSVRGEIMEYETNRRETPEAN